MTPLAPHITAFLRVRLPLERNASPHTCDSYAYAFQLLFEFTSDRLGVIPSKLSIEHLDAPLVLDFLAHLQGKRKNSSRTRNARLAAIQSFMRFLEHRVPSALDQIRRVRAIPTQRTDTKVVAHLNDEETRAILNATEPRTRLGLRDRAMLLLALTGGLRVSELVGIRVDELTFADRYLHLSVRGKGRRERVLTLWKEVGDAVRAWLAIRGDAKTPEVFVNAREEAMTRSGFEGVLEKYAKRASKTCPSICKKRVSPHTLRHTCAFNMLRATGDVRKVALWLGHAGIETVELYYLRHDPTQRIEALTSTVAPELKPGKFRPPDRLLASLRPS